MRTARASQRLRLRALLLVRHNTAFQSNGLEPPRIANNPFYSNQLSDFPVHRVEQRQILIHRAILICIILHNEVSRGIALPARTQARLPPISSTFRRAVSRLPRLPRPRSSQTQRHDPQNPRPRIRSLRAPPCPTRIRRRQHLHIASPPNCRRSQRLARGTVCAATAKRPARRPAAYFTKADYPALHRAPPRPSSRRSRRSPPARLRPRPRSAPQPHRPHRPPRRRKIHTRRQARCRTQRPLHRTRPRNRKRNRHAPRRDFFPVPPVRLSRP